MPRGVPSLLSRSPIRNPSCLSFLSFRMAIFFLLTFLLHCSPTIQPLHNLEGNWEYSWGRDLSPQMDIARGDADWQEASFPGEIPQREGDSFLLIRRTILPFPREIRDPALFLRIALEDFRVYLDGELIYEFGSVDNPLSRVSSFVHPHIITLPNDYENKELRFYFHSSYNQFIGVDHEIYIANRGDLKENLLVRDFPRYLLSFVYLVLGIGSMILFFIRKKSKIFLYYGLMVLFNSGLTMIASYVSIFFFENKNLPPTLYNVNLYFLPLSFYWFLGEIYKNKYQMPFFFGKIIFSLVALLCFFLVLTGTSSFLNIEPFFDFTLIPGLAFLLYVIGKESLMGDKDSKILFFGLSIVAIFTIHDILRDMGLYKTTIVLYWYGIFIFMIFQGIILFIRLYDVQKNYELKENELRLAQKIQNSLIPTLPSRHGDWELESFYSPMKEVGGDFFDIAIDEKGNMGVIILDVSGHGVGAAIISSMAKVSFSHCIGLLDSPAEMMRDMNLSLMDKVNYNFATAFYLYIQKSGSVCSYSSAGHPSGFLVSHFNNDVVEFRTKSRPIGISKHYDYSTSYLYLTEGDLIFLYTDGVIELMNPQFEEMGEYRIKEILLKHCLLPLQEIKQALIQEFKNWSKNPYMNKEDDLSFVLLRYKGEI